MEHEDPDETPATSPTLCQTVLNALKTLGAMVVEELQSTDTDLP